jgi:hypothetical protein
MFLRSGGILAAALVSIASYVVTLVILSISLFRFVPFLWKQLLVGVRGDWGYVTRSLARLRRSHEL